MIGPYYLYVAACTERWRSSMITNTGLAMLLFCLMQQGFGETKLGKFQEHPALRLNGLAGYFF